jgi:hypothetical protein
MRNRKTTTPGTSTFPEVFAEAATENTVVLSKGKGTLTHEPATRLYSEATIGVTIAVELRGARCDSIKADKFPTEMI